MLSKTLNKIEKIWKDSLGQNLNQDHLWENLKYMAKFNLK